MRKGIISILTIFMLISGIANGQLTIKDQERTPNTLFEVIDDGISGVLLIPPLVTLTGDPDQKLYNIGGTLYWNGQELGKAYSAGGWTNLSGNIYTTILTDKVGIGTSTPSAALHVTGNDGVIFGGTEYSGSELNLGAGTRMMWYPKLSAFRAGSVTGTEWDDVNIGEGSVAMGQGTKASNWCSVALGRSTNANGQFSTAMGYNTNAQGYGSTTMGEYSTATGRTGTAMGYNTKSESSFSTAIGTNNIGGGDPQYWIGTDPLFEIGNGYSGPASNAVTVLKNGNVGIGIHNPSYKLDISGGNLLVRGDDGYTASGHEGIIYLGSVHSYIKAEYGYGVKIGAYAAPDAISIKQQSGNVGIGTTTPSRKLYVNGDAGGAGDWHNDSDRRLKKNIKTIPGALEKVNNLRGVNFEWINSENHSKGKKMGFIAQEAKEVIPEVVSKSGEYYSMQYASITALLVEAVKEQNKDFRTENVLLKKRVEHLEKIVAELVNNRNNAKLTSVLK